MFVQLTDWFTTANNELWQCKHRLLFTAVGYTVLKVNVTLQTATVYAPMLGMMPIMLNGKPALTIRCISCCTCYRCLACDSTRSCYLIQLKCSETLCHSALRYFAGCIQPRHQAMLNLLQSFHRENLV